MPLPVPSGETESEFVSRCMSELKGEFPDEKQRAGVCYKQFRAKEAKMPDVKAKKTRTFKGVEIARTGTFEAQSGRVKFSGQDFDNAEEAYKELGEKHHAIIKLGHDEHQKLLQEDGYPNAGFLENIRRSGNKLLADLVDVPEAVAELIEAGRYRARSLEAMRQFEVDGKKWPFVITGLALLGADLPAIDSLEDVATVYASQGLNWPDGDVVVVITASKSKGVEAQGNVDALIQTWDQWAGSYTKCLDVLSGKPGITDPEALCVWLHHEAEGKWPGEKASIGGAEDIDTLISDLQELLNRVEGIIYHKGGAPKFRTLVKSAVDELRTISKKTKIKFKESDMELTKLAEVLGLKEDTTEEAIMASLTELKARAAGNGDKDIVAKLQADLAEAQKRLVSLEGVSAMEKATRDVDEAIKARRFVPASRETLIKMAVGNPAEFGELIKATPENAVLLNTGEKGRDGDGGTPIELTETERKMALQLGLSPEEFMEQKALDAGKPVPTEVAMVLAARRKK